MKLYVAVLAFSAALFGQVPAVSPPDSDKVVLTIGDQKITEAQFDDLIDTLPAQYQLYVRGEGKRAFAEQVLQVKVLSQEAEKRRIDQQPKVRDAIAFQRENLLAQAMVLSLQDSVKVDDAAVEKYYNAHKADYEVLRARHILIRVKGAPINSTAGKPELTDEEALAKAQTLRKRILAGDDFAMVAKAESDDKGTSDQGGDLGEFKRGSVVPPFEDAAFAATLNEVTEPVKTPFGYHLIKVESHVTKSLAETRAEIEKQLRPELARTEIANLRRGARVQLDESFFGPALPGATR